MVRSCGASDAEIKLHHDRSFGIFMDENAPVVIKEALSWMDRTIKKVDEEDESGGGGELRHECFGLVERAPGHGLQQQRLTPVVALEV